MKKGISALLILNACVLAYPLDWQLPVFTVKYELSHRTIEDPDPDENFLIPASLGNLVSLSIRENAHPLDLGLTVRYSMKDYLAQLGDYSYFAVDQTSKLKIDDSLTLGLALGGKWASWPEPGASGVSKDYLAFKGRIDAGLGIAKGTSLDLNIAAEYGLYDAEAKRRQLYTAGAGFSTRLGELLLSARYHGEFRSPLGPISAVESRVLQEGTLSFQWDPNR